MSDVLPLEELFHSLSRDRESSESGEQIQALKPYGIGIDTHSKFISVCVLIKTGNCVRRWQHDFTTDWHDLLAAREWALRTIITHSPDPDIQSQLTKPSFTIESTGCYHLPVIKAFDGIPSLVNPLLANQSRRKTDILDARLLAYHSIVGLWPESFLVPSDVQEVRVMWSMRSDARRSRLRISNRINNIILRFGHTIGAFSPVKSGEGRAIIEDLIDGTIDDRPGVCPEGLPDAIKGLLKGMYENYDHFDREVKKWETSVLQCIKGMQWPVSYDKSIQGKVLLSYLTSVPGVGEITAVSWLVNIVNPARFHNAKAVGAFAGCDPSLKISAGKITHHTRRSGNVQLHTALLQAAQGLMIRRNEPIGRWGFNLSKHQAKGGWKKSVNAVARRLATALYYVHSKAENFDYSQYKFTDLPAVPFMRIQEMALPTRTMNLLMKLGYTDSVSLIAAYYADLSLQKGVGQSCLNQIKNWISIYTSASKLKGKSLADQNDKSLPNKRGKPS